MWGRNSWWDVTGVGWTRRVSQGIPIRFLSTTLDKIIMGNSRTPHLHPSGSISNVGDLHIPALDMPRSFLLQPQRVGLSFFSAAAVMLFLAVSFIIGTELVL